LYKCCFACLRSHQGSNLISEAVVWYLSYDFFLGTGSKILVWIVNAMIWSCTLTFEITIVQELSQTNLINLYSSFARHSILSSFISLWLGYYVLANFNEPPVSKMYCEIFLWLVHFLNNVPNYWYKQTFELLPKWIDVSRYWLKLSFNTWYDSCSEIAANSCRYCYKGLKERCWLTRILFGSNLQNSDRLRITFKWNSDFWFLLQDYMPAFF